MFNWDDLRFLLAVARHGSTISAARSLGVDQSTVQRRLAALEARLGLRLVERSPRGYRLTPDGEATLGRAEAVAEAVQAFESACAEIAHESVLRLTCPEPIADRLARSGFLDRFQKDHPGISVEFVLADRYVDLARGDADVAFRSGDTEDDLVGRKVADSLWAVYASVDYVRQNGAPDTVADIGRHAVIGFDNSLASHRLSLWLAETAPGARVAARADSVLGLVSAAKAGVGLAALPTPLGDGEPGLLRVLPPVPELSRSWRLLCHPDSRRLRRVSAFFDFVEREGAALRPVLTG